MDTSVFLLTYSIFMSWQGAGRVMSPALQCCIFRSQVSAQLVNLKMRKTTCCPKRVNSLLKYLIKHSMFHVSLVRQIYLGPAGFVALH